MTIEAAIGFEAVRNWWGRSFCVWELLEVEGAIGCVAYQRDLALAAILGAEHERLLQSACRVGQGEEGLVRSLRCLSVDGCEVDLQRVGGAQSDCLRERRCSAEPGGVSLHVQYCEYMQSSLVLRSSADTSAFAGNRNGGIFEAPRRSRCN
jgi:hypothetical protein